MFDQCRTIRMGQAVPDFELETFDLFTRDFSEISLALQNALKKWRLLLFFYPADFTFVCAPEFALTFTAKQPDRPARRLYHQPGRETSQCRINLFEKINAKIHLAAFPAEVRAHGGYEITCWLPGRRIMRYERCYILPGTATAG